MTLEEIFSNSANKNKMSANSTCIGGKPLKLSSTADEREQFEEPSMDRIIPTLINNSVFKLRKESKIIGFSTVLFHFCALISFISLGGVRTLLKFYYDNFKTDEFIKTY
jgi:hypothetical protein